MARHLRRVCQYPKPGTEEDPHAMTVELLGHPADASDPSGQIAKQIELVAIIYTEIRVDVPDQHRIDGPDPVLCFR